MQFSVCRRHMRKQVNLKFAKNDGKLRILILLDWNQIK